ncbi:transmembrane protein 81 isoform X2 [Girardinichthys multiradiatus]|uniref:transmembrane protein 81 isoform X2 n=1 Tax=Girardinichthys multiradiatus TaxID=208333 RepID=UPI001FAE1714|nr:transmembrane protein 81 isoform X2 [Girardinichthys multiradiatus]
MHIFIMILHFLLLLHLLIPADMEEEDKVALEVITDSSSCSTTCGLGVKTQTLCLLKDSEKAIEVNINKDGRKDISQSDVSKKCRVQKVKCLDSWQCGLRTITVTSGQRVEIDCLGEVMETMGKFSWRVSWRVARGIISSDDSLFTRWEAPHLDRVVLDPVREEDAGTYRCNVQDTSYRRLKRAYWGIRVLPSEVVNLDYQSSLTQWEMPESQQNLGVLHLTTGRVLLHAEQQF